MLARGDEIKISNDCSFYQNLKYVLGIIFLLVIFVLSDNHVCIRGVSEPSQTSKMK